MQIRKIINEARRNPEHPSQQKLYGSQIFNKYRNLSDEEIDSLYVSFTTVDKIGMNPQSSYNTPIGIYTYPLKYVMDMDRPSDVPWAGDSPNIWVIRPTKSVLHLKTYNNLDVDTDKISKFLLKDLTQKQTVEIINDAISAVRKSDNIDASRMWNLCRAVGRLYGRLNDAVRKDSYGREMGLDVVYFNYAIRKILGYNIIRDDGLGIIHSSEPIQTLFLSKDAFEVIDKLNNKINSYDPKGLHPVRALKNPDTDPHIISVPLGSKEVSYLILDKKDKRFQEFMALKEFFVTPEIKDNGYTYVLPEYIADFYERTTYDNNPLYKRKQNFDRIAKWVGDNPDIKQRLVTRLNSKLAAPNSMDKTLRKFMHDFFPEEDKNIKW